MHIHPPEQVESYGRARTPGSNESLLPKLQPTEREGLDRGEKITLRDWLSLHYEKSGFEKIG